MKLFVGFIIMVLVAIVTMAVMGVILKYLDKCVQSIKTLGHKVWFTCIITIMLWVLTAVVLDAIVC